MTLSNARRRLQLASIAPGVDVLPAIAVGWRWRLSQVSADAEVPWVVGLEHQLGGYGCLQADLLGMLLPLRENVERLPAGVPVLIDALRRLGDPAFDAAPRGRTRAWESEADELAGSMAALFGHREGAPLAHAALPAMDRLLHRCWPALPGVVGGTEALLDLAPCDLLASFGGLHVASFFRDDEHASDGTLPSSMAMAREPPWWRTGARPVVEEAVSNRTLGKLHAIAGQLGCPGPARAFLLWENVD